MILKFRTPIRMTVFSFSGGGKTTFVSQLIDNQEEAFDKPFEKIYYFAKFSSSVPINIRNKVIFQSDLPTEKHLENSGNERVLIVLDDLAHCVYDSPVVQIMSQQGRHRNLSYIILTQNLFSRQRLARDINLNSNYIILLRVVRDLQCIQSLSRQLTPLDPSRLSKIYYKYITQPFKALVIDLNVECNDLLRFRSDVFNEEATEIFLSDDQLKTLFENEIDHPSFGKIQVYESIL
jgi:hypothetical protein